MIAHYPQRFRWRLDGPWRVYDERPESGGRADAVRPYLVEGDDLAQGEEDTTAPETEVVHPFVAPDYPDGDWREIPPATHERCQHMGRFSNNHKVERVPWCLSISAQDTARKRFQVST